MPWTWRPFGNPPIPVNGEMVVPTDPGLGLKFAADLFGKCGPVKEAVDKRLLRGCRGG